MNQTQMLYRLLNAVKALSVEVETLRYTLHSMWVDASAPFVEAFKNTQILDVTTNGLTYNGALYSGIRNIEISQLTFALGQKLTNPVEDILALAYTNGVAETGIELTDDLASKLRDDLSSTRLASQVIGYAAAYFERFIDPLIMQTFASIDTGKATRLSVAARRESIINTIESDSYWRILSSIFASRAYNFAIIDTGYYAGYKLYTIVNPGGGESGSVCDGLIGRTFPIDRGLALAYVLETAAPGGDKLIYPQLDQDVASVKNLTDQQLIDLGYIMPPFHPHCRSQVELLS